MKRYIIIPLLSIAACSLLHAQDTYINEHITNNSSDVIGTARYVGMGGALGALGADISVISWNPAGIGLYRKNDIALTFGGLWGKSYIDEENRGKGTFDQAGFVYNIRTGSESCPYINFAFNYQKKLNFHQNFYANNNDTWEMSQMDQLAELADWDEGWQTNLTGLALDNGFFMQQTNAAGEQYYINKYGSTLSNIYKHHSSGGLHSFDFNISTNISDRAFLGLTVGVDNMRYRSWDLYGEDDLSGKAKYDVNRDIQINGTGVNVKFGAIIRPIADSPFRFGFAVETPTWYRLKNSTLFDIRHGENYGGGLTSQWESYLKFNLRSPWKVRASIGSTIGSSFAWDVDYEFGAYAGSKMGYPETVYADGSTSGNMKDKAMNQFTKDILRGTHTLRVGFEANATKHLAFRLGYNLSTSAYKKNIGFDQYNINSAAMDYATSTCYMRPGTTNILTLGAGYRLKNFYIDLAYKLRNQSADFYAFDDSFTSEGTQFSIDNPMMQGYRLDPVDVNLTRHAITCSLGFKF